jgi:outer membrane protein assembly factor BamD (BamD/ComL family)
MKSIRTHLISLVLFLLGTFSAFGQSNSSRKPEIIRDTDTAEGKDNLEVAKPKEPNPLLSEQNINIGNFYLKRKNYDAAIQRYLEAIEYQPDSAKAYAALAQAYEENGESSKAIGACKDFLEKYPNSSKSEEFRKKLAKLEKKSD